MHRFSITAIRPPLLETLRRRPDDRENQNDGRYVLNVSSDITSE